VDSEYFYLVCAKQACDWTGVPPNEIPYFSEAPVFSAATDGGVKAEVVSVFLHPDVEKRPTVNRTCLNLFSMCCSKTEVLVGGNEYARNLHQSLYCGGSYEAQRHARAADIAIHYVCLPWKVLIAFVPKE